MKKNNLNRLSILLSFSMIFVAIIGSFFVTPVILNNVGDANYGLFSFSTSVTSWLTVLTTAVGSSYVFFAKKDVKENGDEHRINSIYRNIFLAFGLLNGFIVCSIFPILYFNNVPFFTYGLEESKLIYLLLFISSLQISLSIILNLYYLFIIYKEHFFFIRLKNLLVEICLYGVNVTVAILSRSIIAVAITVSSFAVISCILNVLFVFKLKNLSFYKPTKGEFKGKYKIIFKYVSFVLINSIITTLNNYVDRTILGFVDPTFVTLYQLSFSFPLYLGQMNGAISETYMVRFHENYNSENKHYIKDLFYKISKVEIILMILISFGFISCGRPFVNLWIGESRNSVYFYSVALILLGIVPNTLCSAVDCERAQDKHKFRAIVILTISLLNVGLSILLINLLPKDFSIWSCIIGTAFSKIIGEWIIIPIYDQKIVGLEIKRYYLFLVKISLFGIVSAVPCILEQLFLVNIVGNLPLFFIEGSSFLCIFIPLICLMEKDTVKTILKKIRRKNIQSAC